MSITLTEAAILILNSANPVDKVEKTRDLACLWFDRSITKIGNLMPPDRPARPEAPFLCSPKDMPKRSKNSGTGRLSFIHAIAHIELNAIDLAWDMVARFANPDFPKKFYDDWVQVAVDEANHFDMLNHRLESLGSTYGAFPAHDGLWEAAEKTSNNLLARLALVPMTLEARGLDTTDKAVAQLIQAGDMETARILQQIAEEEIPHVAAGVYWFNDLCDKQNLHKPTTYQSLVKKYYHGRLKKPFNDTARKQANFPSDYYQPLG